MLIDTDTLKMHLRVDGSHDDAMIRAYGDAAEDAVVGYLDRSVHSAGTVLPAVGEEGYDATAIVVTPAIISAILLLTGSLYENREGGPSGEATLPADVRRMLAKSRYWRLMDEETEDA